MFCFLDKIIKNIWVKFKDIQSSLNEFFWMWLASISPLLFGSLFVVMSSDKLSYIEVLMLSVEPDAIFAYVASIVAAYLYFIRMYLKDKTTKKSLSFGGIFIAVSFVIAIITVSVFVSEKTEKFTLPKNSISKLNDTVPAHSSLFAKRYMNNDVKVELDTRAKTLLICYLLALMVWLYTIYLNNKQIPDLEKESNMRVQKMMGVADSFYDGDDQ